MNLVSDLDLPTLDDTALDFSADRYHQQLARFFGVTCGPLAQHIDTNILNLTGEQRRRLRALVSPALTPRAADRWHTWPTWVQRQFGILWPGSSQVNPNHGPEPYVS